MKEESTVTTEVEDLTAQEENVLRMRFGSPAPEDMELELKSDDADLAAKLIEMERQILKRAAEAQTSSDPKSKIVAALKRKG